MLKIKFYNLKKIFEYIGKIRTKPINYPSVFSSVKKMILFFLLYLFITGIAALIVIFAINKNQDIVIVPKVINLEFYKAYKVLSEKGFNVEIELKTFNNIYAGRVAFQSITEQKKVKQGRKIKLIVSIGESEDKMSTRQTYEIITHIIHFKLPEIYNDARVKIVVDDEKESERLVFDQIITRRTNLQIPVKIHGQGIKKIYINDKLFIEKDFEYIKKDDK